MKVKLFHFATFRSLGNNSFANHQKMITHAMLPTCKAVLAALRKMEGFDFVESRALISTLGTAFSDNLEQAITIASLLVPSDMRQINVCLLGESERYVVLCQNSKIISNG